MEATMVKSPPRTLMEVFRSLPEGTLAQLIENQLIMTAALRYKHQRISNDINVKLSNFINHNQIGEVLDAPIDVYLDDKNAYQPDIIFISNENKGIIYDDGLYGAPDLVIEILSKSTAKYDLKDKKNVYERSGVREYWVVYPESKEVEGYFLEDGNYGNPITGKGSICSRLLDHELIF